MDTSLNFYKYYNLGKRIKREEIIESLKKAGIDNFKQHELKDNYEAPEFISYPEPVKFDYEFKHLNQKAKVKVYSYGVLSIKTMFNFEVDSLEQLHGLVKQKDISKNAIDEFNKLYDKISNHFTSLLKDDNNVFSHTYSVYCIDNSNIGEAYDLVDQNKDVIISLLTEEYENINFSDEQKKAVLDYDISYFNSDYTAIYWNNALIIDNNSNFNDKLFIIELANIQFNVLKTYDEYIDQYLSDYFMNNNKKLSNFLPFFKSGISNKINEIMKLRFELEKVVDVMDNFEKFQGEWYLARVYYLASKAFQIDRWRNLIENRIKKVNELYNLINSEINRKRILWLNILMLLLFLLWFIGI
ncbi:MAG: hypothetical protein ACQEQH_03490 [Bacillota bacterium]